MAIGTVEQRSMGFRKLKGDASRNDGSPYQGVAGIVVPIGSRDLHIISAADVDTDVNVSNPSHPTLYIHSQTTPATDYLSIAHDGTTATISVAGGTLALNAITSMALQIGGTSEVTLTASALAPTTSDGNALGTTALMWADLFLASGGVINFDAGDVTITHGTNVITVGGGDLRVADGFGLVIGHTSQLTVGNSTGADTTIGELQAIGTNKEDATLVLAAFNSTATLAGAPVVSFLKSANTTVVNSAGTAVSANTVLGGLVFFGADGTDFNSPAAAITAAVDAAVGTGDMPGRIVFSVTADGGETLAEAFRITNAAVLTSLGAAAANVTAAGAGIFGGGIAFTDVAAAHIDDATHGAGTTTIYIGNQTITTSSDSRLKTDIEDTKLDAMGIIRQMRVVDFAWTDPDGTGRDQQNRRGKFVGMIAQEMIDLAPWIINAPDPQCATCRMGEMCAEHTPIDPGHAPMWWHVQYEHFVPAVVKGMQELDARIAALEAAGGKKK